jgi:hypothetical protein
MKPECLSKISNPEVVDLINKCICTENERCLNCILFYIIVVLIIVKVHCRGSFGASFSGC